KTLDVLKKAVPKVMVMADPEDSAEAVEASLLSLQPKRARLVPKTKTRKSLFMITLLKEGEFGAKKPRGKKAIVKKRICKHTLLACSLLSKPVKA
ncbi:MAG: hypothetical protein ACO4AU_16015, partial [bacterium]